jgi:hypothetical protein
VDYEKNQQINELEEDWELARAGKAVKKIAPLE